MKNFYMTLLSNSSLDYYPENRTNSFTVQLPRYMSLEGEWEVALVEIQYPYTFSNVEPGQNEIHLETIEITEDFIDWYVDRATKPSHNFKSETCKYTITDGFYSSIKDIIDVVNETINVATKQSTFFNYNQSAHRIAAANDAVEIGRKWIENCKLSPRLGLQMGYPPDEQIQCRGQYAPHTVNAGVIIPDKMLIYCDILEPQLFGDSWAKVLRVINTNPTNDLPYFAQPCSVTFNTPHYTALQKKHFESVTIDIKDIESKFMAFQYGTLTVKLHFRRIKQF